MNHEMLKEVIAKIMQKIESWEHVTVEDMHVEAIRTAALLSAIDLEIDHVPEDIFESLQKIESDNIESKAMHVFYIVRYLHKLHQLLQMTVTVNEETNKK